jgi:hypothetical protein
MSKIKIASYSATTFLVAGKAYTKGDYIIKYKETEPNETTGIVTDFSGTKILLVPKTDSNSVSYSKLLLPFDEPQSWTSFLDSTGTSYGSFDLCVKDLVAVIANPTNATVSDLIADKASVTQGTSKNTTVVSNTLNTIITTVALSDALDTEFNFTFTNSKITATSNVLPTVNMNGGTGKAVITVTPSSGSAVITVSNIGVASFNSAIKIGLVVV